MKPIYGYGYPGRPAAAGVNTVRFGSTADRNGNIQANVQKIRNVRQQFESALSGELHIDSIDFLQKKFVFSSKSQPGIKYELQMEATGVQPGRTQVERYTLSRYQVLTPNHRNYELQLTYSMQKQPLETARFDVQSFDNTGLETITGKLDSKTGFGDSHKLPEQIQTFFEVTEKKIRSVAFRQLTSS